MKSPVIIVCFILLLMIGTAAAEDAKVGFVKNVSGQASIARKQASIPAKVRDKLYENDVLNTGGDGSMGVILQDNSVLSLGPNSRLVIKKFLFEPANQKLTFNAQIKKGTLTYLTGLIAKLNRKGVQIETPTTVCGIRGTHLAIKVDNPDEK
jgi:hypothetical protein